MTDDEYFRLSRKFQGRITRLRTKQAKAPTLAAKLVVYEELKAAKEILRVHRLQRFTHE